jgi:hypothetical protein
MSKPSLPPNVPSDILPEPYRGMFQSIDPDDIYVIWELPNGQVSSLVRVPSKAKASELEHYQSQVVQCSKMRTVRGVAIRSLILQLCNVDGGHYFRFVDTREPKVRKRKK